MIGWRPLRVGRVRVIRATGTVLLVILVWHIFHPRNPPKKTSQTPPGVESISRSPGMQIAEPNKETRSSSLSAARQGVAPEKPRIHGKPAEEQLRSRDEVLRQSNNLNPRYHGKAVKERSKGLSLPKAIRNQHFLQQNQFNLMGDFVEEEEEENDYRDDPDNKGNEGKWNGRNRDGYDDQEYANDEQDEENNANEEKDEVANDDSDLDDVGGEKLKKNNLTVNKDKAKEKINKEDVGGEDEEGNAFEELIGERDNNNAQEVQAVPDVGERGNDDNNAQEIQDDAEDKENLMSDNVELDTKAVEKDLAHRRLKIREVCAKYGIGSHAAAKGKPVVKHPPTPNYDVFYIDRHEDIAWCPIYKAASTSWLYNFLILGGIEDEYIKNTKEQISSLARRVWPPLDYSDAEQAFDTCLKFMIVRHPFERLVSAYRDKLENINIGKEHGVEHFYKKYGSKIVAKYRPAGQGPPALRYSQDMDDPSLPAPKGIEPTFSEFVKYLIGTDLVYYADDHWMPYYLHCTPCLVDYDVIAKFETLERDQNYIIMKKHLNDRIKPSWKHLTKGVKTSDTVRKYFATITKKDLMDLYEKYKIDFELFDYSVDEYLDYVKDS